MSEVAIIIVSYNMPEAVAHWMKSLSYAVRYPCEIIVVDNGSDPKYVSRFTTVFLKDNIDTLGGMIAGLTVIPDDTKAVWFISTSTSLASPGDPVEMMYNTLKSTKAVAVAPALTGELKSWPHKRVEWNGEDEPQLVDFVGPFSMWNVDFLAAHPFNTKLTTSWGLDFEMSYLARKEHAKLVLHHGVRLAVQERQLYTLNRGGVDYAARRDFAFNQMENVLSRKYGPEWRKLLGAEQ